MSEDWHEFKDKPPVLPQDHPDILIDLQEALEQRFRDLIDDAKAAGWDEATVAVAIGELADHYVLELAEHRKLAEKLELPTFLK